MIRVIRFFVVVLLMFVIAGCGVDSDKQEIIKLQQENRVLLKERILLDTNRTMVMDSQTLAYRNSEKLASIEMKKEIAKIEQTKEIEALKLKQELEKKKLENEKLLSQKRIEQNRELSELENELRLKRYIIALVALLVAIISFFIYLYYKRKRENKLKAYNDNLDKYFRSKENEARVKIAEKILDTISSGKLSIEHEARLIEVFKSDKGTEFTNDPLIESNDDAIDIEISEESK